MKKYINKIPIVICFIIAFAFSIKGLREPDIWWQIRAGEWIIEHNKIPQQDIFSYTFAGKEWFNVKWGSELIFAFITKLSSPELIFVLQGIISSLMLLFLHKSSKELKNSTIDYAFFNSALFISSLTTLIIIEYRMIGRPEMFSHLFTSVFLYYHLQNKNDPGKNILWLLPIQILWVNLHEGFGIGIIITMLFLGGLQIENYVSEKKIGANSTYLIILLILQIISLNINPRGIGLIIYSYNIIGQLYENKYTVELYNINDPLFWRWNVYGQIILLLLTSIGCLFYFLNIENKNEVLKLFIKKIGIGYFLTIFSFIYLATIAYRNVAFLAIVLFPLLVFGLSVILNKIIRKKTFLKATTFATCIIAIGIYILIVSNKYYKVVGRDDSFGLEVISIYNPEGAADFIKQQNIKGICFSDFSSSYLLWKLQPEFKTFIDLRDLDVYPKEFFLTFDNAINYPEKFNQLDSIYNFEYVVLYRSSYFKLHNYLSNNEVFKTVYVDPVSAIYVKASNCKLFDELVFSKSEKIKPHILSSLINKTLNPFYHSFDYLSVNYDLMAANYFINTNRLEKAEKHVNKLLFNKNEEAKAYLMLGEIYYNRAYQNTDSTTKSDQLRRVLNYYTISLKKDSEDPKVYLALGNYYFYIKDYENALKKFELVLTYETKNINAFLLAAECCKYLIITENKKKGKVYERKAIIFYKRAEDILPENQIILSNLALLYFRSDNCDLGKEYLNKLDDNYSLNSKLEEQFNIYLNKCEL